MGGKDHYQVLWKDGSKSYEPVENITDDAIRAFHDRLKTRRKRK
jgi:hypothetical protein